VSGGPAGRARAVFFGSGPFAVPILEAVSASPDVELVAVVSVPDRAAGRHAAETPTPVTRVALDRGLPVLRLSRLRDPEAMDAIADLEPAVGILADYGRIVPEGIIAIPARGILNVHPSLLPRWRGAAPIQATIAAGDDDAGVTLIAMDEGIDSGPIVAQERWALDGRETSPALEARAAAAGAALLVRTLGPWLAGEIEARPQAGPVTMTKPLRRADGRLDPLRAAVELERQVRAFQPWPGSFLEAAGGRLIVQAAAVGDEGVGDEPGSIVADGDGDGDGEGLALSTSAGRLRLLEVQPAGGRRMTGAALRRGRPELVGARVASPD
jgi:methionyl-tRNA formyltransferase